MSSSRVRQAVVFIHGIGEQRPMSTVRGFVDAVLDAEQGERRPLWSKPDRMSESFELRRLEAQGTRRRPTTDFYEYYWAYLMEGTKLAHVWPWLRAILLRRPSTVPRRLQLVWVISWLLAIAAATVFVVSWVSSGQPIGTRGSWTSLALAGALALVQGFAVNSLGDAARYLSPLPSNIAVRQKIRSNGIDLLRRLHESGRYDRIVVVGHSLGAVIGYDMLTHLWTEHNARLSHPDRPSQGALNELDTLGKSLSGTSSDAELQRFREQQRALWKEQRALSSPWLVTDFVTLGSPLAYATILLATDKADLQRRQAERDLPTCPPIRDDGHYSYVVDYEYNGQPRSIRILHHAAVFAPTRWTNIFFPVKIGLLGDLVGGPARPIFGPGILDIPVTDGTTRLLPLLPHTYYWRGGLGARRRGATSALGALRRALDLDSGGWLGKTAQQPAPAAPPVDLPDQPVTADEGVPHELPA